MADLRTNVADHARLGSEQPQWALVAAAISPIALTLGWALVEGLLLPRLIPRDAIDALAEAVMRDHPEDPEGWAFREEHAAWVRSRAVEQGRWRRVRRRIRARVREGECGSTRG